jgi:hypothetical protein
MITGRHLQTFVEYGRFEALKAVYYELYSLLGLTPCSLKEAHCSSKTSALFKHNDMSLDLNRRK